MAKPIRGLGHGTDYMPTPGISLNAFQPPQLSVVQQLDKLAREAKDSNPKDAIGTRKVPFSTIPAQPLAELGLAMLEGALKYRRHNYRIAGVRASVYYDAMMRHITAWWEGEDIDPKSGLPHVIKAMACLVVLRDAAINNKLNDDRPPAI